MISKEIAFCNTSFHQPRGRADFFTRTSFFPASIWWQMKCYILICICYSYSNAAKLFKDFTLPQCITFIKLYQNLFLTKAVAVGKFLDISLSRVQVLTSQISSGLSLNTTARYCLKQTRIYSSKSHLSILLHMSCSHQHSGDPHKLRVSRANQIPLWCFWFSGVTDELKNVWKRVLFKANRVINFWQVVLNNYCGGDKGSNSERAAAPLILPCSAWINDCTKYQNHTKTAGWTDFSLLQMPLPNPGINE